MRLKYDASLIGDKKIKDIFYKAHAFAMMNTTCHKLAVGAIILDADNYCYYGANINYNDNGIHNCKKTGDCYKAKITGIYESCEETRKYCQAQHCEINAIETLIWHTKDNAKNVANTSSIYITRYPCVNCAKEIVSIGLRDVHYCGKQEISDEVKKIFDDANVKYTWYPQYDFEGESIKDYKWWTEEFAEKAYNIVKDRKFPVTIPGYNRPALPTLWNLGVDKFTDEENWQFIIIVRESQEQMYKDATKDFKWVIIKSFPDKVINNAGAVRRTTQKWLNAQGIRATFQMDDDVHYLGFSIAGRKGDGTPKSMYVKSGTHGHNTCRTLAMWQIAMEKAMDEYNVVISCGQQIAFSWKNDYCLPELSMQMMCGPMTQVVCFNIEELCKSKLYHNNNPDVGFDDIDFTIRCINTGHKVCCFPWLVYGCEALGGGNGDKVTQDKLKERFKNNQSILKSNHEDKSFVKFRVKRGLDQCCLNFHEARKYLNQNFNNYPEDLIKNNKIDIWETGDLINDQK